MTYTLPTDESITEGVVAAVAEFSGREPVPDTDQELNGTLEPLYDAIDPDALDTLFRGTNGESSCEITFQYMGFDVTVADGQRIDITRREPASVDSL